jgi:hypothetical protein
MLLFNFNSSDNIPSRLTTRKKMRTTVVVTRWDLVERDDLLLIKAVQSVCDRLKYDMFPPRDMIVPHDHYRRTQQSHPLRIAVVGQLKPQSEVVGFERLHANPISSGCGEVWSLICAPGICGKWSMLISHQPADPGVDESFRTATRILLNRPLQHPHLAHMDRCRGQWQVRECTAD